MREARPCSPDFPSLGPPFLLPLLLFVFAGCVSDVTVPETLLWEGDLAGEAEQPLASGSTAAVSRGSITEVGISVSGLLEGHYEWAVVAGECSAPGALLGAPESYPELTVGESGSVSDDAVVGSGMRAGGAYHAEVRTADSGSRVACGALRRR